MVPCRVVYRTLARRIDLPVDRADETRESLARGDAHMQQSDLTKALIDISGHLKAGRGVSGATLESARAAIARALSAGQSIESMLSPGFVALPEANAAASAKLDKASLSSA